MLIVILFLNKKEKKSFHFCSNCLKKVIEIYPQFTSGFPTFHSLLGKNSKCASLSAIKCTVLNIISQCSMFPDGGWRKTFPHVNFVLFHE